MHSNVGRYFEHKICLLKSKWHKIPEEFRDEFNRDLLKTDLYRGKLVAIALLIASIPLLYIDYLNYMGGLWDIIPGYRLLFYCHFLLALIMFIPLIIIPTFRFRSEYWTFQWQRIGIIYFFFLCLAVAVSISLADQKIHGAITAYLIGVLGFAAIVYIKPVTSLLLYLTSLGLFFAGLSKVQTNPQVLQGHYINSAFMVAIGWIVSAAVYSTKVNDFLNKKGLEFYANFDYLTGCLNRRAFIKRLDEEMARAKREQTPIAIVLVDIDLFKQVNDKFGHQAGDLVLKQLIECFNYSSRKYDFIGRFGGEEFIICLPNTALQAASEVAERFRRVIENTRVIFNTNQINITVSLGVAALEPAHNENVDKFISRADTAMYQAKLKRNNVCLSNH
ncbi:MAG: GGDEF domain-containing protein [Syntrophomonadaceae bacterium]|nr:GGDEF domain-containing protein [Syntrophomonadaceae bacterium]